MAYLTKSRFKLGIECPTKLYYDSNRSSYKNDKEGDPFMMALAKGGFQVGELSKLYYPGGIDIDTLDAEEAIRRTEEALLKDEVVIFEAAIKSGHKFIRIDILHKSGNHYRLIEVKSKSVDGGDLEQFQKNNGDASKDWRPYLEDVSFQYLVLKQYLIGCGISPIIDPYLMCCDKTATATKDNIHQNFLLLEENGRSFCKTREGVTKGDLGSEILIEVPIMELVTNIIDDDHYRNSSKWGQSGFENIIDHFEQLLIRYESDGDRFYGPVGAECKTCQFQTKDQLPEGVLKSGFRECFQHHLNWTDEELNKPKGWDVWDFRTKEKFAEAGKWFMDEMEPVDLKKELASIEEPKTGEGLSRIQRQWTQVTQSISDTPTAFVDREGLGVFMGQLKAPYHFIDFETTAPAIPFYKGYRSYEGLCFQFSHHQVEADGTITHKGEYLGLGQGVNPSYEFIDRLYKELSNDDGTVFMYSHHENTYLRYMERLLEKSSPFDPQYTAELISFLQSLTVDKDNNRKGDRAMVDMAKMVKNYYWHPMMKGSNSIKKVLPAVMNASKLIRDKYSKAIYGSHDGIQSFNFKNHKWVEIGNDDVVVDPYELLLPLEDIFPMGLNEMDTIYGDEEIGNGGAAMTAWAYMQYQEMSDQERDRIAQALKCYCELDTMAMVLIWEYFQELTNKSDLS